MSQGRPIALAALAVLSTGLAGCITSPNPVEPATLPEVPLASSLLGFAKEVAIDANRRGGEPSIAVDSRNHYYASAPSGFVSTVFNSVIDPSLLPEQGPQNRQSFIWKSEDQGATWRLLAIMEPPAEVAPALRPDGTFGGADTDLAIDDCDTVYYTDLWLGNVAVSHSDDGGATWIGNPYTGILPILDRQWLAAGNECGEVFLLYQTFYGQVWVLRSTDKGMTWPQQVMVLDCNGSPLAQVEGCYTFDGNIAWDRATDSLVFVTGLASGGGVMVLRSADDGMSWTKAEVPLEGSEGNDLIPAIATDAAGNLYAVFATLHGGSHNIYLTTSTDEGATWTAPVSVSGPLDAGTELFPWVAAGDEGRVAVVWYGTEDTKDLPDDVEGDWFVYLAVSENAADAVPSWQAAKASEKPMHQGEICTQGLFCTLPQPLGTRGNRNLADFFEVAIDREGRAVIAYSDDYEVSESFISLPYFIRQTAGPVLATPAPAPVAGR